MLQIYSRTLKCKELLMELTMPGIVSVESFDKSFVKLILSPRRASARVFPEERVSAGPRGEHRVVVVVQHQHPPLLPCLRVQTKEG